MATRQHTACAGGPQKLDSQNTTLREIKMTGDGRGQKTRTGDPGETLRRCPGTRAARAPALIEALALPHTDQLNKAPAPGHRLGVLAAPSSRSPRVWGML